MAYSLALDVNESPEELDWRRLADDQEEALMASEWYDPEGAVRLNDSLDPDRVKDTAIVRNARLFLDEAESGLETTNRGNLKRYVVDDILEKLQWPEDYEEDLRARNKVLNEQDVWRLHHLRVLVELSGLIEQTSGSFQLTSEGCIARKPSQAGDLYSQLFHAQFQVLNLNYFSRFPEYENFQATINYTLFRLSELDDRWYVEQQVLPHIIWFPMYLDLYQERDGEGMGYGLYWRLFEPLRLFGLLELRETRSTDGTIRRFLQKTDLYDQFLSFDVPDEEQSEVMEELEERPITREDLLRDLPEEDLELLLDNVFCHDCGTVRIVGYEDSIYRLPGGDTVLRGSCAECGGEVSRYIETGEL